MLLLISVLLIIGSLKGSGETAPLTYEQTYLAPDFYLTERIAVWIQMIVGGTLCTVLLLCALASGLGY